MVAYALDIAILMVASFWHVLFLISMGLVTAAFLWLKINTWNVGSSAALTANNAWKLLFFGVIYGVTDYLAGMALSVNKETLLKLVGFSPVLDNETSATMTTTAGTTITTITISQDEESKKNWFDLYEVAENWNFLFMSQRALQFALPFVYIFMTEAAVIGVFITSFVFFNPSA